MILMACPYTMLVVSLLLALRTIQGTHENLVVYSVTNNALDTPGGLLFNASFPKEKKATDLMKLITGFLWNLVLDQKQINDRKQVKQINLVIGKQPDLLIARELTNGSHEVLISARYIHNICRTEYEEHAKNKQPFQVTPLVIFEVRWILTIGIAQHLQWRQDGDEPRALRYGIGAYAVLKARYEPFHWAKAGEGKTWDEKYDVTGQFFCYVSKTVPHFVAELNKKMKTSYSPSYFKDVTGKTIDDWWSMYKKDYQTA